jgi:splicing factor 3B subunit 3
LLSRLALTPPTMTSFSTLSLYALTVKPPSATQDAISGDFIGNGQTHILSANGSRLTLYRVSEDGFKELFSQDVFGIVRRISKFRLAGSTKGTFFPHTQSLVVIYQGTPTATPLAIGGLWHF